MKKVKLADKLICKRCGYEWRPRQKDVRVCPDCHSVYWDKEKKKQDE